MSEIARQNRLAVNEAITPKNVERSFAVTKGLREANDAVMMIERGWTSMAVTNWCGAWRGTDFSPVVVRKKEAKAAEANGLMNGHGDHQSASVPGPTAIADVERNTVDAPDEPSGISEGALRTVPEIVTAQPVVLGHALQRHIKICRCESSPLSFLSLPN